LPSRSNHGWKKAPTGLRRLPPVSVSHRSRMTMVRRSPAGLVAAGHKMHLVPAAPMARRAE
jgi:hypothetical protein